MTTIRPCRVCGTKKKPAWTKRCAAHTRPRSTAQQMVLAFVHAEGKHKQGRTPKAPMSRFAKRYQDRLAAGVCVDCGDGENMLSHRLCARCFEKRGSKLKGAMSTFEMHPRDIGLTCPVRWVLPPPVFVAIVRGQAVEHQVVWPR